MVNVPATLQNPAIPWADIEAQLNPGQRGVLRNLQSTGYVILDGSINEDGTVKIRRVVQSHPDHGRDQLALAYAAKAVIQTKTSGSMIAPMAEIYVLFYGKVIEGDLALTFARKRGATGTGEGNYLNIARF